MKVISLKDYGGVENFIFQNQDLPEIGAEEVLVKVAATALNRADVLQRKGLYPPPPGESDILGLEMSGTIVAKGAKVERWNLGDQVCSLLAGGGYATHVKIHQGLAMPIPKGVSLIDAAAIPEVFLTAYQAVCWLGKLKQGEKILIHAGASGVGSAAIQIARNLRASVIVTASSHKHTTCLELGAEHAIDYKQKDFESLVKQYTDNRGVDLIIDFIGGPYFQKNINSLNIEGRLVMLGFLGGTALPKGNLGNILFKRLQIMGSTLRSRSLNYKTELSEALQTFAWPLFDQEKLKPIIDSKLPWEEVAAAHLKMEKNENIGKIILKVSE